MPRLDMQCRPRKMKEIVFQSMPPDTILLNLDNGYYYSTNHIGADVWERCNGENSLARIVSDILSLYDAPKEAEDDILSFVRDMVEEKLLSVDAQS